jgi:hypothetical protein
MLPLRHGQALLLIISLVGLLISSLAVMDSKNDQRNFVLIVFALVNLHTFDLLSRGNIDGLLALGIGITWLAIKNEKALLTGIGLWLLSIKPINVILAALVFVKAIWQWSNRDKFLAIIPLFITSLISFPVFGFDWPYRYINALRNSPPLTYLQTSLWRFIEFLGFQKNFALWLFGAVVIIFVIFILTTERITQITLALALSLNLVFSPYSLGSHYVLLVPAFLVLTKIHGYLLVSWLFTLTPLVRLFAGFEFAWIDILYPISLLVGAVYIMFKMHLRATDECKCQG